jgi:hypothetical protein
MDRRCDAFIASGLRAAVVANSGLSQASPGQVRLCSLGLGARLFPPEVVVPVAVGLRFRPWSFARCWFSSFAFTIVIV